mmetsp:Transcript_11756/g.32529  ORF Transcript_11756/g.32529 Transcript_11756/m.32529 type:complete len:205 (+) Transcript_11756:846-1460(+)
MMSSGLPTLTTKSDPSDLSFLRRARTASCVNAALYGPALSNLPLFFWAELPPLPPYSLVSKQKTGRIDEHLFIASDKASLSWTRRSFRNQSTPASPLGPAPLGGVGSVLCPASSQASLGPRPLRTWESLPRRTWNGLVSTRRSCLDLSRKPSPLNLVDAGPCPCSCSATPALGLLPLGPLLLTLLLLSPLLTSWTWAALARREE